MNTELRSLDHGLALQASLEFFSRHVSKRDLTTMILANLNHLYPHDMIDLTITPLTDMHIAGNHINLQSMVAGE